MDTRVQTALQTTKAPSKKKQWGRVKEKKETPQRSRPMDAEKESARPRFRRERKIALQKDVDKLKKRLRHEETLHRALERAFTRPLGALPRLPPCLPQHTLELLAEVAVLEEEVVRLEEQVVNLRQCLYQEAIYASTSKKAADNNGSDLHTPPTSKKPATKKQPCPSSPAQEPGGNENLSDSDARGVRRPSPQKKVTAIKPPPLRKQADGQAEVKRSTNRLKTKECSQTSADGTVDDLGDSPNRISEDALRCLVGIFSGMRSSMSTDTESTRSPSVSGCDDHNDDDDDSSEDPYGIRPEFGRRDVGPYKGFLSIDENSVGRASPVLIRRLKLLLRKLAMVDLRGLNHQQKLAFWINVYNSCMMNAFLEHGIPSGAQMVAALMQKAMINVGGHLLSAMTIEHFMLRRPYQSKYAFPKGLKNDEMTTRSILSLDWPEPLVTFALSCGSWSSPAVRVYTASQVENELETAKRDYLQAAIGIPTTTKLAIPKLLDWYLLDFAKDVESLMDWICLQLPSGMRNDAVKCIERVRRAGMARSQNVQVLPYDFSFRYILAT